MLSRARIRVTPRIFRPTSATQNLSTQSAPVLQSSEEALRLAPDFSEGPAGSRQSSPLRRDRSIARRGIRSSTSWRSSPLTPLSRSLRTSPALQPSDACLTRLGDFPLRCRDANADFHHPRRLPPVSIRAPDSFRSRARDPLARSAPVSNLARRRGYASRLAEDFVRLRRLVLAPEVHARGVPAKASSCLLVPFVRTCVQPEDLASRERKPEQPVSAVLEGRTGTPVRALDPPPREVAIPLSAFDSADPAFAEPMRSSRA